MRIVLCLFMGLILTFTANFAAAIVINEINFDPGTDANGDGVLVGSQDEYVELVNEMETVLDLTGWQVSDDLAVRFTFPAGVVLGPGEALVVFGGGVLDNFSACVAFGAGDLLSLNNAGDTVRILDAEGMEVAVYAYIGSTPDVSLTRYPDVTGGEPLVVHDTVSAFVCSPGTQVDGSPFPIGVTTWYRDQDDDGYGDVGDSLVSATQPAGYVAESGDCDDTDNEVHPGAPEVCGDGKDNDCNGAVDDGCPAMVINEINYDPGSVDANNDGSINTAEDEFVELVNISGSPLDITGWTLSDLLDVRHVFSGLVIPPDGVVVVFGGGNVNSFTACPAYPASSGLLSLNNTGDTVTLRDSQGTVVASYAYPGDFYDVSITRYPDATGSEPLVPHTSVSILECSPGLKVDGTYFIDPGSTWYLDSDDDGYGDDLERMVSQLQPAGFVAQSGDCDDQDETVNPGAPEVCGDGIDNNCDGETDEGCAAFEVLSVADVGGDQGRQVRVRWSAHEQDTLGDPTPIASYSLYRRIDGNKNIDTSDWDFLMNIPAATQVGYAAVAPTLCDSTDAGICWSVFTVRAHTLTPGIFYDAEPDSGYSIDNLAPSPPENPLLAAGTLSWDEPVDPDVRFVTVYGSGSTVRDGTETVIGYATGTDFDVSGETYTYYLLTATDFAGNEGLAVAVSSGLSAVPGVLPARTALLSAVPNPFNPSTKLPFEMARTGHVRLRVFDVAGRLVRDLVDGHRDAGRYTEAWDGRDDRGRMASAGVYLYRLETDNFTDVKRMVLLK